MSLQPDIRYTPEEYLDMEREADYKSEYFNGEIFAMSGASRRHNIVSLNIAVAFHQQLRHRECEVYMNDMRVKVSSAGLYTYPDVMVVCDPPQFDDTQNHTLLNPNVIVEVLSKSTEAYDRGMKFEQYRRLDSFAEYLLIHQDKYHIEHYVRQSENSWLFSEYENPEDMIHIRAIRCELRLGEIYEKVNMSDGKEE